MVVITRWSDSFVGCPSLSNIDCVVKIRLSFGRHTCGPQGLLENGSSGRSADKQSGFDLSLDVFFCVLCHTLSVFSARLH